MTTKHLLVTAALLVVLSAPALAQTSDSETQRDVNQQNRIEQGLKSGQLSTGEAAKLEKGEGNIDDAEAKALKDGTLSPAEKARIQRMQNRESRRIDEAKHNDIKGNPNSPSSERMQKDVQRDANQERRVHEGLKNGSLTNKEAGGLERREGRNDRMEGRAGRDGHVNAREQRRMERHENRSGRRIKERRHNDNGRHWGRGRDRD